MLFWVSVVALIVTGALCWGLYRSVGTSRIDAIAKGRRPTSRLVSRGVFVDGNRHLRVALALTSTELFYEDSDLRAYLDLRWVHEVEYDTRLATGNAVYSGRVLRIRCYSQLFEFVLPNEAVPAWQEMLPPRSRADLPEGTVHTAPVAVAV